MSERPTALYRLNNHAGELLYVGIAYNPAERWQAHESNDWWAEVTGNRIEWHPTRELAAAAEVAAIKAELPLHNRAHTGRPVHDGIALSFARSNWADIIHASSVGAQIIYLTSNGRRIAAMVPLAIAEQAEAERKASEPDGP